MEKGYQHAFILIHGYSVMGAAMEPCAQAMRDEGFEAVAPHIAPYTGVWDRCCELYAILKGGRVDYGKVHSEKHGHDRFGATYPGILKDWGEELPDGSGIKKAHLIGHSFGGMTAKELLHLLTEGSKEEREGTPASELSPLFEGGKHDWVISLTTVATPHRGTTSVHGPWHLIMPYMFIHYSKANLSSGTSENDADKYQMDMMGFTSADKHLSYKPLKIFKFLHSKDSSLYQMRLDGAKELNSKYQTYDDIYYFAQAARYTESRLSGKLEVPSKDIIDRYKVYCSFVCWYKNKRLGIGNEWKPNDGLVNVISAKGPANVPKRGFKWGEDTVPGVWNIFPTEWKFHVSYLGEEWPKEEVHDYFSNLALNLAKLPVKKN